MYYVRQMYMYRYHQEKCDILLMIWEYPTCSGTPPLQFLFCKLLDSAKEASDLTQFTIL